MDDNQERIFKEIIENFWDFVSAGKFSNTEITSFFDDSMEKIEDPKLKEKLSEFKDLMTELFC
jgi:hypothetical protein